MDSDSDSDSGQMDSDSHLMDSDSGLMDSDSDSDSGLVDSDSLLDSRVRTHSNTGKYHSRQPCVTLPRGGQRGCYLQGTRYKVQGVH